jgi:hypothetical protein
LLHKLTALSFVGSVEWALMRCFAKEKGCFTKQPFSFAAILNFDIKFSQPEKPASQLAQQA